MNRRVLKRFYDRKKDREEQKQTLLHDPDYVCIQAIINQTKIGDNLNIPEVITSLEKFAHTTFSLNENQKALYVEHSLLIGECLDALRIYIDKLFPRQWVSWSITNIPFVCSRNCQNWVKLSRENGVHEFAYLGISALVLILSKIEKLYPLDQYTKRFQAFFAESSYPFREYHQTNNVKKLLACHTFEVNALREGIRCNAEHLLALAEYKDTLNEKLIEDLLQVQADNGSVEERLKRLIIGKGSIQKLTRPKLNQNMPLSFDRTVENTKTIVKYYITNYDKSEEIKFNTIEGLIKDLTSLYWGKLAYEVSKNI